MNNNVQFVKSQEVYYYDDYYNSVRTSAIRSIGKKYIILDADPRIKYDRNTLREINYCGCPNYIIPDIDEYRENIRYKKALSDIRQFNYEKMSKDDIYTIKNILDKYKKNE